MQTKLNQITMELLTILFLALCSTGCGTTGQTRFEWGEWQTSSWHDSGRRMSASVKVETDPQGVDVVVDNLPRHMSQNSLQLPYAIEERTRERVGYRKSSSFNLPGLVMGILSFDQLSIPTKTKSEVVTRQQETETRVAPRTYQVSLQKSGYFTRTIPVTVPQIEERTLVSKLARQETITVGPVEIVEGIKRQVGVFTWLRDSVFFPHAIPKDQYPALAERIASYLRAHLFETGVFCDVDTAGADGKEGGARLSVQVQLYGDHITLNGQLQSAQNLGNRRISREVQIDLRDFQEHLNGTCGDLIKDLVGEYRSSIGRTNQSSAIGKGEVK